MRSFTLLATVNLCLGGLVFLLGLLILRENPRQRLNRVVAMMLFFGGFGSVLAALSFLGSGAAAGGAAATGATAAGSAARTVATPESTQNFAYLWEFFF